jgi:hypothetical protein
MHFCHEHLVDVAFFSPAHSCCDKDGKASCQADNTINQMNHCKDESIIVESTDDYVGSSDTFNFENTPTIDLLLTAAVLFNYQNLDSPVKREAPWYKEPPPYKEVELSKIQTYLI